MQRLIALCDVFWMICFQQTFFLTLTAKGWNFASVCCTELKISTSKYFKIYPELRQTNTFNASATNLSGLYKAIRAPHLKGKT